MQNIVICLITTLSVVLASEQFQCKDSAEQISITFVNDGYCDCADGSDEYETYVCNTSQFVCKSELQEDGSLRTIASSLVNDGICDCCDCSDEFLILPEWTDQCEERNTIVISSLIEKYEQQQRGYKESKLHSLKESMKSIRSIIKQMKKEMNHIYSTYQKTNRISDTKQRRYKSLSRRTQLLDGVLGLVGKKDKASLRSIFGEQLEYLPLILGECVFSEPFGEQEMKRGTSNFYNKHYSIEFCPFVYLIQVSNQTETWRKRNDFVSHGGSRQAAAQVTLPNDYSSEHTLIGSRNDWLENFEIPDHWKVFAEQRGQFQSQVYEGEDVCIDGSTRKTLVLYECGVVNEVKEFREYGMCNYQMIFETPFACSKALVDQTYLQIQQAISQSTVKYRISKEVEQFL